MKTKIISIILAVIFAVAGFYISINRFWQLDSYYYDFGIFDTAIWKVAHFTPPIIDHYKVGGKLIFGDHFSPGIFILSPLYWLTDKQEVIHLAQAIFPALAGIFLFLAALKATKSNFSSLVVQITFYLFAGLQNAIITDFHELTIATLPIALMIYAIYAKKLRLYILSTLWVLAMKESLFIVASGLHLFTFFQIKPWRKYLLGLFIFGLAYSYIVINYVIPGFSGLYQYNFAAKKSIFALIKQLYDPSIKVRTVVDSLASFSFTSLATPILWPTYIGHYASRFFSDAGSRWEMGMHYNAEIAPVYALSMISFFEKISKINKKIVYTIPLIILMGAVYQYYFILKRPFALSYNQALYQASPRTQPIRDYLAQMPSDRTIMAPNHLAAHLTHKKVILVRDVYAPYSPEIIIFDTDMTQGGTNWYGVKDPAMFVKNVQNDPNYQLTDTISSYQVWEKK